MKYSSAVFLNIIKPSSKRNVEQIIFIQKKMMKLVFLMIKTVLEVRHHFSAIE